MFRRRDGFGGSGFNPVSINVGLANDLYLTRYAPKQLLISGDGTGATTNAGLIAGYSGLSGYGALWGSTVTPSTSNFAVLAGSGGTTINAPSGTTLDFAVGGGGPKVTIAGTAGAGPAITAGTATTDVNALSATQTWNAGGVAFTGLKYTITDTASAAGSMAMQIFGGAAGTTNLISVSKAGLVNAPAYAVGGAAGVSFGPAGVASITVVNGIVTAIS